MKPPANKRAVWSWALYDWANSAFTTSILAVIYGVYFVKVVVPMEGVSIFGRFLSGASLWSFLNSTVMVAAIILSPMLGAIADQRSIKRYFLVATATLGSLFTMGLVTSTAGSFRSSTALIFFAILFYELSLVFYNAFLNDISDERNAGRVSGLGFALGYVGGGLCLALNLGMLIKPALFGLSTENYWPYRISFLTVGVWWLVFSLPAFVWVKDDRMPNADFLQKSLRAVMVQSFIQLKQTLQEVVVQKNLWLFLVAFVFYNDGIQTILLMASIFGAQALGMSASQLGLCYLVIQFVAFVGAYVCGRLADSWSHKKVILSTLVLYVCVTVWAVFMKSAAEFWGLGVIVGLILGGSQAASRSFFSIMIPDEKSGEYFALFSVVGKASALLGPFVFGVVNEFAGLRAAVGSLIIFFLVGGGLLLFVKEKIR